MIFNSNIFTSSAWIMDYHTIYGTLPCQLFPEHRLRHEVIVLFETTYWKLEHSKIPSAKWIIISFLKQSYEDNLMILRHLHQEIQWLQVLTRYIPVTKHHYVHHILTISRSTHCSSITNTSSKIRQYDRIRIWNKTVQTLVISVESILYLIL